jgi:3-dehydroquinate synthase
MDQNVSKIQVNLNAHGYNVFIGDGNISDLSEHLHSLQISRQIAIISTPPVSHLYLQKVTDLLNPDWDVVHYDIPDGESSKCTDIVSKIYTWLLNNQIERNSTIIALGGGVVGDLAGFVAATYLRGINLVHLPTSLLAQVDSSIGGKVGINHPLGKNLIGAFYQPRIVITDVSFLDTLALDEYVCGMGEVIKYGIISGDPLLKKIETNLDAIWNKDHSLLINIIEACVRIKTEIVEQDEKETGVRAYLNLGHTFAHALETFYHYERLKHGQAVLLGIKCAFAVSQVMGMINKQKVARIGQLIDRMNIKIPANKSLDPVRLLEIMKRDKKTRDGNINLVLAKDFGDVILTPVTDDKMLLKSFSVLE